MREYYCGMHIEPGVVAAISTHARCERPRECCGILLGTGDRIVEAVAAGNVAAEPLRSYEVSPADHIAQIRRCRDAGGVLRIVGVYHSHPHSAPVPSPTDLEQAYEEYVYLIAGPADDSEPLEIRAYRFNGGRFADVQLSVTGGPASPPARR
jgi:proteasome lid subunit RPN8/RPN11